MVLLAVAAAAEEHMAPLFMPNWAFALTAFVVFLFMGVAAWSFRDVANRHAHKTSGDAHRDAGDHSGH